MDDKEIKNLGITDEELGYATNDDAMAAAPELVQQQQKQKAGQKIVDNGMPVPSGTPDYLAKLYRAIPRVKAERYKRLWKQFENKDLSLVEFSVEMEVVTNSELMQRDLDAMVMRKKIGM